MKKALVALLVGCLIVGGGIIWVSHRHDSSTNQMTSTPSQQESIKNHINGTPINEPFATVIITTSGFSPSQVEVKMGNLIHFINKTTNTIEIIPIGTNKIILGPIEANKTEVSLPLTIKGDYEYSIKDNNSIKGSILVQ